MASFSDVFKSTYTKIIIGAVLAFAGVVGGIYVGYGLTVGKENRVAEGAQVAVTAAITESSEIAVRFAAGDAFPPEIYFDQTGTQREFDSLLRVKSSVIIFATTTCGPCLDLVRYAHDRMLKRLKESVQVVVILDRGQWPPPQEYVGLFQGINVCLVDHAHWQADYHWVFWPIIVGTDNSGIIQHMQYGYTNAIDREIVELYYSAK
jgi:hypothetical protein